ncbi:hypothetical protein J2Y45_000541 [Dyadobacter sp. BE34]|uniref:Lipoprotein n=1 Tax=Dyadobacter fermentans TaxID=94254 RepID=A0ABU1QQ45_9BACT|nr:MULTISPECIES: hypothetical protein [Dyadobacter]MDR6803271.1 hypothetical protein [Dyadobacter fermentans]MDR7041012.1 hypothetical protein [Dyadobacter sp. BE242]MDR7195415.1 hypothetical protein [Dyadobacter sp. BE34]MDR7214040.1 hypothetical protein [Dyadobacter sp. BE31]MDR7260822.1 hypothetical protein [Dyadobacter sp. BE32]
MKTSFIAAFLSCALLLTGCGSKQEEKEAEEKAAADSPADALQAIADKAKEMGDRKAVDPVDFRKLKDLLPETLAGMSRTEATGEKTGAMGFTVSTAEAKYKGSSDESLDVEIVDTGGIAGVSTMALAAWSIAEIDKETTTGYEKTTTIEGYKAFEKYNNESKSGEINVLVADRYVVNVEGNNLSVDQLKDALKAIDLSKLNDMK